MKKPKPKNYFKKKNDMFSLVTKIIIQLLIKI